jgi:hypothetical protein
LLIRQSENVLAGCDSGRQLRPDNCSNRLFAGGQLAAAMAEQFQFSTVMDSKLCDFLICLVLFSNVQFLISRYVYSVRDCVIFLSAVALDFISLCPLKKIFV